MAQQRRVKPAVGVAAVGLGIGVGALGLHRDATAEPPRLTTWAAPATAASLLAEGRELVKQNRLGDALAKADAAAKLGNLAPGGDTPEALRKDAIADGKKQIEELTAQSKVLARRGDKVREAASLELARQIAAEIGQPTAPPSNPVSTTVTPVSAEVPAIVTPPPVQQTVVFHPADPTPPAITPPPLPDLPPVPVAEVKAPSAPTLPTAPTPVIPTPPAAEKPLLPAVPALSLTPSGPVAQPAVPAVGEPSPAPGATPVTLPKLATAAVGAALSLAPALAQDATPKPAPAALDTDVARPIPSPSNDPAQAKPGPTTPTTPASVPLALQTPAQAAGVTKEQFDALKSDLDGLKDYKRQVQDLLQGKADGTGKSVLDAGVLKRLSDLEDKLDRLEKTVETMRLSLTGRTALSPNATAPMPAPTAVQPKTAVKLVNDYPSELSLILNGTSHRLKPGETKTVGVPPGSFTYELIADGATPITRTIRDDETVTLRIK